MSEYHVCGVLLMSHQQQLAAVIDAIDRMPGAELHANEGGRLVVTVEGEQYADCADKITALATLSGVASSSLVFHQMDNEDLPEELAQ